LTNYYDILGVKQSASTSEIKTAFRSLAKLYHPDKNPSGQDQFKKILLAYETLIHPTSKYSYDLKLKYHQNASTTHSTGSKTKNWSFEEKEMKRRQYYNEHIKKYEKVNRAKAEHANLKKNYNEYKYILYATPLAVLLFLLVINFATPSHGNHLGSPDVSTTSVKKDLKMGDSPYSEWFGGEQFFEKDELSLNVSNQSNQDLILCLFSGSDLVRCCFIKEGYSAEIPQLPNDSLYIKYSSGKNWDENKKVYDSKVKGAFSENLRFYESISPLGMSAVNALTITGKDTEFKEITGEEFFNKSGNH
jgi:curved DNA-binding protein CbpA